MNWKLPVGCVTVLSAVVALQHTITLTVEAGTLPQARRVTQGALLIRDAEGAVKLECPLKHTDVKADIAGPIARVTVTQQFENTARDKVEAVYVFPLPHKAAVDAMTLHVGERVVKGVIKKRDEARAIYEAARNAGRVAALLDQERPNIFTQSVANIMPGEKVKVVISYVELLPYEAGTYEFAFPMVVGPRYIPGKPVGRVGGGWAYDTDRVPDASRITPIVTKPDVRAGHDVSIEVALDAGVPIESIDAKSHQVSTERKGTSAALIRLANKAEIPNKDFVLRYDVAGRKIQDAVLTHHSARGGFFTLLLQPPDKLNVEDVTPKELVFVLDTSGSMSGFPIEKAKEAMKLAIDSLNPSDTFNLITFSGDTEILFPKPVPATRENLRAAQNFLDGRRGGGGTEMMKAIRAALEGTDSQRHVRIVCFMTDGYVGNDAEIIGEIARHQNARVFSFGIGNSANRYLLDKMAEVGRGEVEYVSLRDDGSAAARRFHERVRNPLLTDISLEWSGVQVHDVVPARVPDLFSAKPIIITGRYTKPGRGVLKLKGNFAGSPVVREIPVDFPASEPRHDVLATLWARNKVDALSHTPGNEQEITQLGLEYVLMTQFTSFVAVEETVITEGGKPRRVEVPVELPEGVSYEGVFGEADVVRAPASAAMNFSGRTLAAPAAMTMHEAVARDDMRKLVPQRREKIAPALRQMKGTVKVQIWLTRLNENTMAELKRLGLEVLAQTRSSNVVIGKIDAAKLEALSKLAEVGFIAPAP